MSNKDIKINGRLIKTVKATESYCMFSAIKHEVDTVNEIVETNKVINANEKETFINNLTVTTDLTVDGQLVII